MTPAEGSPHGIRLVCVDFQAKPRCESRLAAEESVAVATEAFPRSLPVGVRGTQGFRALKLFPAGACVGVSHVFDGGAVDEWDRPVLSARVALVRPGPHNGWGRGFVTPAEALGGTEVSADALAAHLDAAGLLRDRDRFAEAVRAAGIPFLSRLAHALAVGKDVLLVGDETPETLRLVTLALSVLPGACLASLRLSTFCSNIDAEGREGIVFVPKAPPLRWSLLSRATGKPGPADRVAVDLASHSAPEMRGGPYGAPLFAAALAELAERESWPDLDFPGWHEQVLRCLDALWDGRKKDLLREASALPADAGERLREMVERMDG